MTVSIGCLGKPFLLEIQSNSSAHIIPFNETSALHCNSITTLFVLEYHSRLCIISIAMNGCIALWDADSATFHHWILKGSNGFPLSFSIANDFQYPLVISYSNGSIGFVDSRECLNIRKQPDIQTTKRLSFLSREEFICDICYVPYLANFNPNFLAMITNRGQLVLGRVHFGTPNDNEDENPLQESFCLQRICSTYLSSKTRKSKSISNKFRLSWITAYEREDKKICYEENILHHLMTNELIVIEGGHLGQCLEASLCICCSADRSYIALACNFQHCLILDVNTFNLIFYMEIAKLHLLSRCISQAADSSLTDKIPIAFSCTDGRVVILRILFGVKFHFRSQLFPCAQFKTPLFKLLLHYRMEVFRYGCQ
ncbi:hypothetical protein Gasu2_57530 [Galdieria sulphuraria]|nr:hypothetical protein Gasu2_57530 [Galdieria sulphuraria]